MALVQVMWQRALAPLHEEANRHYEDDHNRSYFNPTLEGHFVPPSTPELWHMKRLNRQKRPAVSQTAGRRRTGYFWQESLTIFTSVTSM